MSTSITFSNDAIVATQTEGVYFAERKHALRDVVVSAGVRRWVAEES